MREPNRPSIGEQYKTAEIWDVCVRMKGTEA